ncbi:MAG: hypothetical protein ACO2PM_04845 [Pyrobaculum sp.]
MPPFTSHAVGTAAQAPSQPPTHADRTAKAPYQHSNETSSPTLSNFAKSRLTASTGTAYGEDAVRFMRLLAVTAPSAGGKYLSEKFSDFVKETQVEVRFDNIRLTQVGNVAADLTISEADTAVKYDVYLRKDAIVLQFQSTDRSRVELAAHILRLVGVSAEVRKAEMGGRDVLYIRDTIDMLAAGRKELRNAIAEVVKTALARGWADSSKAEG